MFNWLQQSTTLYNKQGRHTKFERAQMPRYTASAKYEQGSDHFEAFPGNERQVAELVEEMFGLTISHNTVRSILGSNGAKERPGTYNYVHCLFSAMQYELGTPYRRADHVFAHKSKGADRGSFKDEDLDKCFVFRHFYKYKEQCENSDKDAFKNFGNVTMMKVLDGSPVAESTMKNIFDTCKFHIPDIIEENHLLR